MKVSCTELLDRIRRTKSYVIVQRKEDNKIHPLNIMKVLIYKACEARNHNKSRLSPCTLGNGTFEKLRACKFIT